MRSSTSGTFNHTFYRHRSRPHLLLVAILVSSWLTLAPSRTASVAADGPTQPINAIKVVEGRDTSCGDGWTKINKDLNEGAAGTPYFYLCYSRGSTNPLTHLYPIVGQSSGISCDSGDTKYPTDINRGIAVQYDYLCYGTSGTYPLTDIDITSELVTYASSPYYTLRPATNKSTGGGGTMNVGGILQYLYTRDASQVEYVYNCGGEGEDPCSVFTDFWWHNGNFACDRGLTELGGECVNGAGELARYNSAMDEYAGSWTDWATGNQRNNLANDEPINWVLYIAAHNGYNNLSDGYFLDPNHKYSLTDQLRGSVRFLNLDVVWSQGEVRLCHGAPQDSDDAGRCTPTDRMYFNAMKEIGRWLDNHPDEIVLIDIEDRFMIDDNTVGSNDRINNPLQLYLDARGKVTGSAHRVYTPSDFNTVLPECIASRCPEAPRWPSRRELLHAGKQVIIFSSNNGNNNNHRGGQWIWPAVPRTTEDPTNAGLNLSAGAKDFNFGTCAKKSDATQAHFWQADSQAFSNVGEDRTVFGTFNYQGLLENDRAERLTHCNVNVNLDMVHAGAENRWTQSGVCWEGERKEDLAEPCPDPDERVKRTIWSWRENDRGQHGNRAMFNGVDGRWDSRPSTENHHFACARPREGNPLRWADRLGREWNVTQAAGPWEQGGALCQAEFGDDFIFAAPVNAWQNDQLMSALTDARNISGFSAAGDNVWLNYAKKSDDAQWAINRRPSVTSSTVPSQAVTEGTAIAFTGGANDPDDDALGYSWDFDDGSTATGAGPTHVYADDGTFQVAVVVDDSFGGLTRHTFPITVTNVAPTVRAGAARVVNEGDTVALAPATFVDQGTADTHTATIDWGDGTPAETGIVTEAPFGPPGATTGTSGAVAGSHAYGDNGTYTVRVCIEDDENAEACDQFQVTVNNVAPVPSIDRVVDEAGTVLEAGDIALVGLPLAVNAGFTDPGRQDTHTAEVAWGDGTSNTALGTATSPFTITHTYTVPGTRTIQLRVADDDGGSATVSRQVSIVTATGATQQVLDTLSKLSSSQPAARTSLAGALDALRGDNGGTAQNGALSMIEKEAWIAALEKLQRAQEHLLQATTADPSLNLVGAQRLLALTAKLIAVDQINQAAAVAKPQHQAQVAWARQLLTQGQTLLSRGQYVGATTKFKEAALQVQGIAR